MKVLLYIIDWEYPSKKCIPDPEIWDLENRQVLLVLYKSIADGIYLEMRVEGESDKVLEVFRGILLGGGSCKKIDLTKEQKKKLWLYKIGDECYSQADMAYFFVDPIPKPEKFKSDNDKK